MRSAQDLPVAILLPAEYKMGPTVDTCSYFVGIWGEDSDLTSVAILPLGMNSFRDGAFSAWGPGQVTKLNSENERLSRTLADREQQLAERSTTLVDLSQQLINMTAAFDVGETERKRMTRQLEDLERQHRKALIQVHALTEERAVLVTNLAVSSGL